MTEAELQAAVLELARLLGWLAYHPFDSRRSERGFPDLTLVRNGHLVFAELKREGRQPTAAQDVWLDALRLTGATVAVWWPRDWTSGEIERTLRG